MAGEGGRPAGGGRHLRHPLASPQEKYRLRLRAGGAERARHGAHGGNPRCRPARRHRRAAAVRGPRQGDSEELMLDPGDLAILRAALERLAAGFGELPPVPSSGDRAAIERVLFETAERLRDNYPYFHPLYAGQMLKPPHPVARLAYALSLWLNPNNHALDGGRASSAMEKEAVAELARLAGWETHLGHVTGGGTMANLEALWVAGQLHPQTTIVASTQAHYTHRRMSAVLGLAFEEIPCDRRGRMDVGALRRRVEQGGVGTVVATIGTTATGSVDSLPEILELRERYGFRLHADAGYRGYFGLVDSLELESRGAF